MLPFKNQIVYDGHLAIYSISLGGGIRKILNDAYNEAKATYDIVTSLPFQSGEQKEIHIEEKLKFYLKNERNRQYYAEEIEKLISRSHDLATLYHQEMGKVYARSLGKRLRDMGFGNAWFGILQGMVVASGKSKENLESNIDAVVPKSMQDFVYKYQLKQTKK